MTPELGLIVGRAFSCGTDVSLRELVLALNLSEADLLGSALEANHVIESMGLSLSPRVTAGDFDTRRALAPLSEEPNEEELMRQIHEGEGARLEFKSSAFCDMNATKADPSTRQRSEGVTHSILKTIAAFANGDGGYLIVGTDDNSIVVGIERDYETLKCNQDRWENELRNIIVGRFLNGRLLNSFIRIQFVKCVSGTVAVLQVIARSEPTYLKNPKDGRHEYYIRQGNRSVALDLHEFAEIYKAKFVR